MEAHIRGGRTHTRGGVCNALVAAVESLELGLGAGVRHISFSVSFFRAVPSLQLGVEIPRREY